jgi:hypothetical protein
MLKVGGISLGVGLGILVGWGMYCFLRLAFLSWPLGAKIGIAAVAVGLSVLLASLGWERYRASREGEEKLKGVEN